LLAGERLKFRVREQHCVNIVGDHHAGRRFIRELRVELETELLEEGHRALEVLHRQVYENLRIHGMSALGLRDWPEVRIRKPSRWRGKVLTHILVVNLSEQEAKNRLWRRETNRVGQGGQYVSRRNPGPDTLIIDRYENVGGVTVVLAARFAPNIL